ncbi:MAG: hypothetical protein EKK52_01715 [Burkholderiales bacterium]|uniref:hypothetical protein n=1 Tax=Roseateles sp. TaxID=1971397 RepID=UPI000F9BC199|nr:MAG: hypothetical protein EKK52_01715 [Burkholderiales bacterium]
MHTSRPAPRPQSARPGLVVTGLAAGLTLLAGCGGGGSSGTPTPPPPPPAPSAVTITGKAVDGALSGAIACYDLNDNGVCDSGEPTSKATGADGAFSLDVQPSDVGKHRVVVQVPATAIDADTGAAVGTAYTLQSPATGTTTAHSVFVSPLTTLVQGHVDSTGASVAEAVALVQAQAGLAVSPLTDFTAAGDAQSKQAALLARLVQATTLAQADALKTVAGQSDLSGGTVSAADVAKQVTRAILGALPAIAGKVAENSVNAASGAALATALADAAKVVVAQAGMAAEDAKAAIGTTKLPPDTSANATSTTASLTALRYIDASNWYFRSLENSTADNVPDASGNLRYTSTYRQSQSSGYGPLPTMQAWSVGGSYARRGDLHWNGKAWVSCKLGDRYTTSVRDAQGRATYNYCDGREKGRSARSAVDIAGQSIASVFTTKIRTYPGGASGVAYADWGPKDPALFGSATFPAGAKLYYQTNTITETALAYDVQDSAIATGFGADVATGGDARVSANVACASATSATAVAFTKLEDLIARNPGKPCVLAKATSGSDVSLDPNESWGTSTASLGVLAGAATRPAGTGNWYSTDLRLRVAFTGGDSKATTYFSCLSRAANASARNCSPLGTGSYSIQTLGDARVMTFSGLPALMQQAGYSRVFVERGGKVYYGYQNPAGASSNQVRLNLEAANAVLAALSGMPVINPTTRFAELSNASQTALTTAKGVWFASAADGSEFSVLRIGDNGRYLDGAMGPTQGREQTGHELGWLDYDAGNQTFRALVESNSNGTRGLLFRSLDSQSKSTLAVTATQLQIASPSDGTSTLVRLTDDPAGIVGLWALGSATEFNTQHFLFLPSGKVLMIDPLGDTEPGECLNLRKGPPGGEYASYTYDKASGTLQVFGKAYDTNGCAGFFDIGTTANTTWSATFTLASDGMTASVQAPGGSYTVYRIAPK